MENLSSNVYNSILGMKYNGRQRKTSWIFISGKRNSVTEIGMKQEEFRLRYNYMGLIEQIVSLQR